MSDKSVELESAHCCHDHGAEAGHSHGHRGATCGSSHDHHHRSGGDRSSGHHHGPGCAHGPAPGFLPPWVAKHWNLLLVAACGLFFVSGWAGERFFQLNSGWALALYLLAYLAGAYDIATHAIPGLFRGRFDTDILMLAAAAGAAALGQWSEGAFLLFLFSLGHAGEHYALDRARGAIDALGDLMPAVATIKKGEQLVPTPIQQVSVGDIAVVRPGDRVSVDGTILCGRSSIDESPITGESTPVEKGTGEEVFAGTINLQSALEIRVDKLSSDSTLSRIVQMVAEAQQQKSPTQDFTQKFTSRFVPTVLLVTALLVAVPPLLDFMSLRESFYRAMLLLVATSPCALALGTPAAVLAGIAQAARNGVLIKGGLHLENLGGLRVIAFDKTGTLTEGRFSVTDVRPTEGWSSEELLRTAASVEQQSSHPLAKALVEKARAQGLSDIRLTAPVEELPGLGVRSQDSGEALWLGSRRLFLEVAHAPKLTSEFEAQVELLESAGKTVVVVGRGDAILGVLALADTPRLEALETLRRLRALGIRRLVMLTGDNASAARSIADQLGLDEVQASLLPQDKWKATGELRAQHGPLAMVGDGVNDAPALAAADVGIAMGGAGTAVALETADVALMADDLSKLPFAVGLSRQSRNVIRQNLFISLGMIVILISTSLLGLTDLRVTVLFHEGSTLAVVANALRLLSYRAP